MNNYTCVEVLRNLRCQTCSKILSVSPIRLLPDGSNICGRCLCSSNEAYINYLYEKLASNYDFPCSYEGCTEIIPWENVAKHEEACLFRPLACVSEGCSWIGTKIELPQHFKDNHNELYIESDEEFELDFSKDQKMTLLNYWSHVPFIVRLWYDCSKDTLLFSVFHVGTIENFDELTFKVKIRSEDGMVLKNIIKQVLQFEKADLRPQNSASFHYISKLTMTTKAFCCFKLEQDKNRVKSKHLKDMQKIKCTVCKNNIVDGVHLCQDQNLVCKSCKCSCQHSPNYIDVYGFQQIGEDVFFPCSHKECPHAYRKHDIEKHISECVFRHFKCEKCNFFAKFSDLVNHCRSKHDAKMTSDFKWFAKLNSEKRKVVMIAEGYIFYFTREIKKYPSTDYCITFEVTKMAVVNQKRFKYRIELRNQEDNSAHLILEGKEQESGFIGGFVVKNEDMKKFIDENNEICYRIVILTCISF